MYLCACFVSPLYLHLDGVCMSVCVGVTQPYHLSSRLSLLISHEHLKVRQVALYRQDSSSLLYQAMLEPSRSGRKGRGSLSSSVQSGGSEEVEGRLVNSGDEEWVYIPVNEEDNPFVKQQESVDGHKKGMYNSHEEEMM